MRGCVIATALAERAAEHNLAYKRFDRPAGCKQTTGKIVQQARVARLFSSPPKIVDRSHNAATDQVMPDPIRQYARRQVAGSALGIRQPTSQLKSAALIRRDRDRLVVVVIQGAKESARYDISLAVELPG